jgi:hypothetical protein
VDTQNAAKTKKRVLLPLLSILVVLLQTGIITKASLRLVVLLELLYASGWSNPRIIPMQCEEKSISPLLQASEQWSRDLWEHKTWSWEGKESEE